MRTFLRLFALLSFAAFAQRGLACNVSATPLDFGPVNPLAAAATDSVGQLTVTCPATTAYSIAIDSGTGADIADRRMASGAQQLRYQLYTDSTRSVIWGDGTAGTMSVSGQADALGTTHQVHGRIPAQPEATPGVYADTLLVTVSY